MAKRNSKRSRREAGESSNTLKMVLKLSAKEHSDSLPASPSTSAITADSEDEGPSAKRAYTGTYSQHSPASRKEGSLGFTAQDFVPTERNLRERNRAPSPKPQSNALQESLLYLHRLIEKRDNQHFFAFPINDLIAPDYSKVIKQPMDFSTMKDKIDRKLYTNIMEYKSDVRLICVNAMNYNHPDTVYYKAAQRLLEYAMKTLSKDRLISLRKNQPVMSSLTDAELALHMDVDASEYIAPARAQKKQRDDNSYLTFEPVPDHLPAKDIIAIAKERAAEAEEMLARRQPNAKMGFLRMDEDGTTTFNILNPDNTGYINDKERVVTLGEKVGKLKAGVPYLESIMVESDLTEVKPTQYLRYGSYTCRAPTYDSSFSSLTKKESDLVLSYYGSQNGLDYIQSLRAFVADCSPALIKTVDDLANLWTGDKHTEAQKLLAQSRDQAAKEADKLSQDIINAHGGVSQSTPTATDDSQTKLTGDTVQPKEDIDFESLKSIADLGIDVSFLDEFQARDKRQSELDTAAEQLNDLHKLQKDRLSLAPNNEKINTITEEERVAAETAAATLASLAKEVSPSDIVNEKELRLAVGVGQVDGGRKSDGQIVDELLNKEEGSLPVDNVTQVDALCHTIPLDESPST